MKVASSVLNALLSSDVRFLIVGGYAVADHELPCYTGVLDALIWTNPQDAERVLHSLEAFGFSGLGLTEEEFIKSDSVIQFRYPP